MSATLTLPSPDEIWSVRDQVLAAQTIACKFFELANWIWASKMLLRAERLSRRLPDSENPFILAGSTYGERRARPKAAPNPPPASWTTPPPSAAAPPPQGASPIAETDEDLHADFKAMFDHTNATNARKGLPQVTFGEMLETWARQFGPDIARRVHAWEARLRAAPSG